jgi:hypothetical protein
VVNPRRFSVEAPTISPGVHPETFVEFEPAMAWFGRPPRRARQLLAGIRAVPGGPSSAAGEGLNQVGWYHATLGEYAQALAYCRQALEVVRKLDDRHSEAATLDSLGYAHHHLGDVDEARLAGKPYGGRASSASPT